MLRSSSGGLPDSAPTRRVPRIPPMALFPPHASSSRRAVDVLQDAGARVHLAHPLGVKGFAYRRVKNDQRDTADLADLFRMNRLPEAYVAPPAVRELRE